MKDINDDLDHLCGQKTREAQRTDTKERGEEEGREGGHTSFATQYGRLWIDKSYDTVPSGN